MLVLCSLLFMAVFILLAVVLLVRRLLHKPNSRLRYVAWAALLAALLLFAVSLGNLATAGIMVSLYLLCASILTFGAWCYKKVTKKSTGVLLAVSLCLLAAGVLLLFAASAGSVSGFLLLLGFAALLALPVSLLVLVVRLVRHRPIKKPGAFAAAFVLIAILSLKGSSSIVSTQREQAYEAHEIHDEVVTAAYDFEVCDGDTPLEVEEYRISDYSDHIRVYDSAHLDLLYPFTTPTAEDCKTAIQNNSGIPDNYKTFFCDFVDRIAQTYPEASLATLYHNLQTLTVQELNQTDYMFKSLSATSLGCYVRTENAIYIPVGTKYVEGEFGFQVILHEFCHAARVSATEDREREAVFTSLLDSSILEECMNSVFSCSLLHYDERDIAYRVPSNYLRIMLECMDNYALSDYMNHGDTWFLRKLDEAAGYTNYARVIWKLITLQRSDWEHDNIDIDPQEYDPIYDFLCELYYTKYITPDMTEDQATAIADELVDKAFYDAPEGYKINPQRFYDNLQSYRFQADNEAA